MARFVSILGKISAKLGRAFGKRPKAIVPKPNYKVQGHRGTAAGSLKKRQAANEAFYRGETTTGAFTAEEVAQWKPIAGDIVEAFVEESYPLFVHSSNVVMFQYFADVQKLLVEYKGSKSYLYDGVTKQEALEIAQAPSKGAVVWDLLRIRGSRTAHKKTYRRVGK